jgi:dTDP-4-amino-4,6-dideoxygalactose transaminase
VGDVGFFSLGRGKNITAGTGGIVVTSDEAIGEALAAECDRLEPPGIVAELREWMRLCLMSLFIKPALYWLPAGLPWLRLGETLYEPEFPMSRLSGTSAGVLRTWRRRLADANAQRVRAGEAYRARLGGARASDGAVPYLRLPVLMPSREVRDRVCALARRRGLGVGPTYPGPVSQIAALRHRFAGQQFPAAVMVAERLVTLPTHHLVSEPDRRAICDLVERWTGGRE